MNEKKKKIIERIEVITNEVENITGEKNLLFPFISLIVGIGGFLLTILTGGTSLILIILGYSISGASVALALTDVIRARLDKIKDAKKRENLTKLLTELEILTLDLEEIEENENK